MTIPSDAQPARRPVSDEGGSLGLPAANAGRAATPLTLSIAEAAVVLGIGVSTAYRLCARGEFPVPILRIGGTAKVSARRLQLYVDGDANPAVGSADP